MHKNFLALALVVSISSTLVGCTAQTANGTNNNQSSSSSSSTDSSAIKINIVDMAFSPATINVKVGDSVTWTNLDSVPHTVVRALGDSNDFSSQTLSTGDSFSHTFTAAGTFAYKCGIHPAMTGQVVTE